MAPSPSILSLAPQAQSTSGDVDTSAVMVTVTAVSQDPATGEPVEETTTASFMGTDEQVAAARDEARELVATLKEAASNSGVSPSESTATKKRALTSDGDDARGMLSRLWWRRRQAKQATINAEPTQSQLVVKAPSDRAAPSTRRNIAVVGLVVAGAAACVI